MRSSSNSKFAIYLSVGIVFTFAVIGTSSYYFIKSAILKQRKIVASVNANDVGKIDFSSDAEEMAYKAKITDLFSIVDLARGILPLDFEKNTKEKIMEDIDGIGIYYWVRSLEILDEIEDLHLTENAKKENKLYKEYCQLNLSYYRSLYEAVEKNKLSPNKELDKFEKAIEDKRNEIRGINASQ